MRALALSAALLATGAAAGWASKPDRIVQIQGTIACDDEGRMNAEHLLLSRTSVYTPALTFRCLPVFDWRDPLTPRFTGYIETDNSTFDLYLETKDR